MTLGPHLDKEGQLIVVTIERGLPSNFLETTRKHSCKYIARNKEATLIFPVPELLAETLRGKEHLLSYLYQGDEDPQKNFVSKHNFLRWGVGGKKSSTPHLGL